MKNRMRVAVAMRDLAIPAWQYELLEQIVRTDHVSLDLVVLPDTHRRPGFGVRAVARLIRFFAGRESGRQDCIPDAYQLRDASSLVKNARSVRLKDCQCSKAQIGEIASKNLDLLLNLGELQTLHCLAKCMRAGVWSFSHDSSHAALSSHAYAGFWEVIKRKPFIHAELTIDRGADTPKLTAFESHSAVIQTSFRKTRNEHLWKLAQFVPRAFEAMVRPGLDTYLQNLTDRTPASAFSSGRRLSIPAVVRIFSSAALYALWRLKLKVDRRLFVERWILLVSSNEKTNDLARYRKVIPPPDRFWADPFVRKCNDDYFIFFEDASLKTRLGHIAVMKMSVDGNLSSPVPILQKPYHLSYPFIFEWDDALYMIPESAGNRTVDLYRCVQFPDQWEFQHNLMQNILAYDATLLDHAGRWWMFANVRAHEGASSWDELYLFHADSPLSQHWKSHPMNPIVSDVRNARPAGELYWESGRLFRPSQDSSYRYGHATNINEILELSESSFRERMVRTISSSRHFRSTHTYNRVDGLTVVDAIYRQSVRRLQ